MHIRPKMRSKERASAGQRGPETFTAHGGGYFYAGGGWYYWSRNSGTAIKIYMK